MDSDSLSLEEDAGKEGQNLEQSRKYGKVTKTQHWDKSKITFNIGFLMVFYPQHPHGRVSEQSTFSFKLWIFKRLS